MSRGIAKLLRLPRVSAAAETRLVMISDRDGERWERRFDDRRLDSHQYHAGEGVLAESIGMLEFRFAVEASDGGLRYRQVEAAIAWGTIRMTLPVCCAPRVEAREDAEGPGRIRVQVSVTLPVVGPVLTYDGIMDLEDAST